MWRPRSHHKDFLFLVSHTVVFPSLPLCVCVCDRMDWGPDNRRASLAWPCMQLDWVLVGHSHWPVLLPTWPLDVVTFPLNMCRLTISCSCNLIVISLSYTSNSFLLPFHRCWHLLKKGNHHHPKARAVAENMNSRIGRFLLLYLKCKYLVPRISGRVCTWVIYVNANRRWTWKATEIWVKFVCSFSWLG